MLREKESRGSLDIPGFYLRRLLRIWPLYFSALAVAFVFGGDRAVLIPFALFVGNFATMAVAVAPRSARFGAFRSRSNFICSGRSLSATIPARA